MRPCLFPTLAFALWRVGSNSRGDSDPQAEAWHESGLGITTKLGKQAAADTAARTFAGAVVKLAAIKREGRRAAW
jgi:hypothetical protein